MDQIQTVGRSLPLYAIAPAIGLSVLLLLYSLSRSAGSRAAQFLVFAVWLRLVMSALHEFTFDRSPLGISWNALGTVALLGLSLPILRRRSLSDATLIPIYPIVAVMLVSGLYNGEAGLMVTSVTKFLYFAVLALAVWDALEDLGAAKLFRCLYLPFLVPIVLQLLSFALGISAGESEQMTSYIGGYNHEAVFSVCLLGAVLVLSFIPNMSLPVKAGLMLYGLAAILLANYRTVILAAAPLVLIALLSDTSRRLIPSQRPLIGLLAGVLVLGVAFGGAWLGQERFADFAVAMERGTELIRPVAEFSDADEEIMSGRPFIWSGYLYAWWEAEPMRKLIGFGPEVWTLNFNTYAHNTLVSTIYEIGFFGAASMLFLWIWMFYLACLAPPGVRATLLAGHISFFILNMATMPMWQVEGMIYYGVLCGYSAYSASLRRLRSAGAPDPFAQRFGSLHEVNGAMRD